MNDARNATQRNMQHAIRVQQNLIERFNAMRARQGVQESMDQTAMRFIVKLAAKFRAEFQAGRFDKYRVR